MRSQSFFLFLLTLALRGFAEEMSPVVASPSPATVRELHYDARVSDREARFTVNLDVESSAEAAASLALFEGDLAVLPARLPAGLRLMREGRSYRLEVGRAGRYTFALDLVAKVQRTEPWNQVSFTGPSASIASIVVEAPGPGVEIELLSGVADPDAKPGLPAGAGSRVRGVLGTDPRVALRWQTRAAGANRRAVAACTTTSTVSLSPNVVQFETDLDYEILQGTQAEFLVLLPPEHTLTRVEGEQIRDWRIETPEGKPTLRVELLRPAEKSFRLRLFSEQTVERVPFTNRLALPQPQDIAREAGALSLRAEDVALEVTPGTGLRQVNAGTGAFAAYRFSARPLDLEVRVRRLEPEVTAIDRLTARVEEARLHLTHTVALDVQKAGLYSIEFGPLHDAKVIDVRGEGLADWSTREGRLVVNFQSRVLGSRALEIELETPHRDLPEKVTLSALNVSGAAKLTAQIGVASAAGIRLKTAELNGLREIPAGRLERRGDEVLAFVADQPDWTAALTTEKLPPRTIAEIFNLVTIGDGLVGGSATIRYVIINQGAREFRVRVPAQWRNVEFTGPNIRRQDEVDGLWTITLQEKAWGGYTLVVTYDEPFDPNQATLQLGGIHALDVERETGTVAVTCAASLQLREVRAAPPLQRIDEADLAETDRALITRSVLLAYRYASAESYDLAVEATRFRESRPLEAVADRTALTTVLTEGGQMLTQATFLVKNNDKQFQRFTLPPGATFWSSYVDGEVVKAEEQDGTLLLPLPRGENRDRSFAVEIVYAQKTESLKSLKPRELVLVGPKTDVKTTYAEWEVFVPAAHHLRHFAGTMTVAEGTAYGWGDAWAEFVTSYAENLRNLGGILAGAALAVLLSVLGLVAIRRGPRGVVGLLGLLAVAAVLAGMMLPALAKAKAKSQRIAAVNNLKQIGLAARIYAQDNEGRLPRNFDQIKNELGSDQISVDPETGQSFIYLGAGRKDTELEPGAVLAFSPVDKGARAVLLADGSVQQMSQAQFAEALGRDPLHAVPNAPASPAPGQAQTLRSVPAAAAANAPAAAVPSTKALISGIRPIRIELPRTGSRFVFTQVLNLGEEPLRVEAWSVTTQTWNRARAALQALAFLIGLALIGWQLRRPSPRSLVVTFGAALVLAAVAGMLLVTRLLGMALIAGIPLAALVGIGYALRQLWRRRKHRETTAPDDNAEAGLSGNAGLSTLAPLVTLLLTITVTNAQDGGTSPRSDARDSKPSPESASILSAIYAGTVHENTAHLEAALKVSANRAGQTLMLFGGDVAVEGFSASVGHVRLVRQDREVGVRLGKKGEATVRVRFLAKSEGEVTRRRLAFGIPAALASQVALTLDEPDAVVECPTAISFHAAGAEQQTRIEAVLGSTDRLEIAWTPRVKRAAETAATVFCQNATLASFSSGHVNLRSVFLFQITQGELREVHLRLPQEQRLLRVEGDQIRSWDVRDADHTLEVALNKGMSPGYRLVIETELATDRLPVTVGLEAPHALEVTRETGWVALAGSDDLGLTVPSAPGWEKVEATEFTKVFGPADPKEGAFQFLKPAAPLSVRVETIRPQVEAVVRHHVRVAADQISLAAEVAYTIKRAGVFVLRLAVPAGYRVESVTGNDVAQWVERPGAGARELEVTLRQRTLGAYALQVECAHPFAELPPTLEIPGVRPLETAKLSGSIVITTEPGVQIKPSVLEGLTEVPVASVEACSVSKPASASGPDGLPVPGSPAQAYRFAANDPAEAAAWKLVVATEAVPAYVRAEIVNWLTLGDALANGRAIVRYEIQNAPVKEFGLRVPATFKNVEIEGANIRRRDHDGPEWRVELQGRVSGSYLLTVTWDQTWSIGPESRETVFSGAGLEALGVERETGAVAVIARSELQIAPRSASPELLRVDLRELPEWAGPVDAHTVLAYRYLRPGYQFTLGAQRFAPAATLQALVEDARLTTVVADDGQMMTEVALELHNRGRQFLELTLPRGATVWSAFVAGQAVRPSLREGRVLLPLERTEESVTPVELIYVSAEPFPRGRGAMTLASPALDVPIKAARWELYLPAEFGYGRFGGTMTHELEGAPAYRDFGLSEYRQAETLNRQVRERGLTTSVSVVRSKLKEGRLDEASKAYNQARRYGLAEAESQARELEVELKKAQSGNLLNAQQQVIANNNDFVQQASVALQQLPLRYDNLAAEQQWDKLRQAQEIVASAARPLRVNLPIRGLRQAFTQLLQTETGKPMEIGFTVTNARGASWVTRCVWGVAAFGLLWGLVHHALRRRSQVAPTAQPA